MKFLWLNRIPRATWAGLGTGLVIALVVLGYYAITRPDGSNTVQPMAATSLASTSPSSSASPSASPVKATPQKAASAHAPVDPNWLPRSYQAPPTDGLVTNEYAFFNPTDAASVTSPDWEMTSGSLFSRGGSFWTGNPDSCDPDPKSATCTNSNVFRLDSKQQYAGNIRVSLALLQLGSIHNGACNNNDTCWHGTHVWLRYQNEYNLYYASVNRADGQVVIKRKVPCGSDNSGTYFVLSSYVPHDFHPGIWNHYQVTIQTNSDQSVTIKLYDTATSTTTPVATGIDRGGTNPNWRSSCSTPGHYSSAKYAPITAPGGIGIRGDFASFLFRDIVVSRL